VGGVGARAANHDGSAAAALDRYVTLSNELAPAEVAP
jgi:hypothetical protein